MQSNARALASRSSALSDNLYQHLVTARSRQSQSPPRAHVATVTATSAVRETRLVRLLVAGLAVGATGVAAGAHRPREEAAVVATLVPLWAVAFGAGLWRSLVLAAAKRLSSFQFETAAEVEDA
jgi:hypothetical protein